MIPILLVLSLFDLNSNPGRIVEREISRRLGGTLSYTTVNEIDTQDRVMATGGRK